MLDNVADVERAIHRDNANVVTPQGPKVEGSASLRYMNVDE